MNVLAVDGLGLEEQVNTLNDTNITSKHMFAQHDVAAWLHMMTCAQIYACELGIASFGMCFVLIFRRKIHILMQEFSLRYVVLFRCVLCVAVMACAV